MRYTTPVFFRRLVKGEYNPDTGNYENDYTEEVEKFASVMDTQTETIRLIYGELKKGSKTIILQQPFDEIFEDVRIGNRSFSIDFSRNNKSFIVSENQGGADHGSHVSRLGRTRN